MKLIVISIALSLSVQLNAQWVSRSYKAVTHKEAVVAERHARYFFCHEQSQPFTQLLFSWNALRPSTGHFEFLVRARNARTKKWGAWHAMADWGSTRQISKASNSDGFTRYEHVRLETEHQEADAFCIQVVSHKGAPLSYLKAFWVTTINMRAFKGESASAVMHLPSVYIAGVPKISQAAVAHKDSERICSPTACTILTQYITGRAIDPIVFANRSYDAGLQSYGSWPFNMAYAFEVCKGTHWFFNTRLNSFAELHAQLRKGIPIIVSVRGTIPGAPQPYPQGHLLVVVGWNNKTGRVICHDPAVATDYETERHYRLKDFMRAWEQSRRLAYLAVPVR